MTAAARLRIATAGWSIPRAVVDAFAAEGSGLARYASRLDAVEINSTFYRAHRPSTLERWAETTPPGFSFALKVPRTVSHERRLRGADAELDAFLGQAARLGSKLGALLLQLPPSLAFDAVGAEVVLTRLRASGAPVACEPRHASWFAPEVDGWLREAGVARVAADPALHPDAGAPGGWRGFAYHRLHGSPRTYRSEYGDLRVAEMAERLRTDPAETAWCVFDNTAAGAAAADALRLQAALHPDGAAPSPGAPSGVVSGFG